MKRFLCVVYFALCSFAQAEGRELMVSASSWAWAPPDSARITLELEATGANASGAQESLRVLQDQVTAALKSFTPQPVIADRGYVLGGSGPKITKQGVVRTKTFVGVDIQDLSLVGKVVDKALSAGAKSVTDVAYRVRNDELLKSKAAEQATQLAQKKATNLASSLGVSLGPVLSASVTERPQGRVRRERRERGENVDAFSDEEYFVTVTLRYGLQ